MMGVALLALLCVVGLGLFALQHWVGSDDFRARVQAQAEAALGVPVALGRLQVDPWPVPAVALEAVAVQTQPALTARRIELRLQLGELLAGRLAVASLVVIGADLPQTGIDQLLQAVRTASDAAAPAMTAPTGKDSADARKRAGSSEPAAPATRPLLLIPRRLTLDDVTWRNSRGEATTLDAVATLDLLGLPDALELRLRAGDFAGAQIKATRQAPGAKDPGDLAWDVLAQHAGGTIAGVLTVQEPARDAAMVSVHGQFETRNLQLGALRRGAPGPLGGRLRASTTLSARAADTAGLAQALVTQSTFTVDEAVINGIDLAKAVQTVGLSRGGLTRLDTLSGRLATHGRALRLSQLAASSGALSATGDVAVAPNRALSGRVNVNLAEKVVGKAVGVPLVVGGTLDAPTVMLTRGAMLGAAIGTLVLPGVGTGAGASFGDAIGDKLKGLFGK